MSRHSMLRAALSIAVLSGCSPVLRAQLQSVEEALQLSKTTGRPIFAMAGNKT